MKRRTVLLKLHFSSPYQQIFSSLTQTSNMPSTDTLSDFGRTSGIKFSSINFRLFIKPIIGETKLKSVTVRRDEVVLHRARIGHTFLTHSYLLKKENSPDCSSCHCLLIAQHNLI